MIDNSPKRLQKLGDSSSAAEVRTSRLQETVKVPQVQIIDEVAKVRKSMQRQVPMIQEMQREQKPEEVQISFRECVDRGSGRKKACTTHSPYLKGRTDKAEVQKDPNVSPQV